MISDIQALTASIKTVNKVTDEQIDQLMSWYQTTIKSTDLDLVKNLFDAFAKALCLVLEEDKHSDNPGSDYMQRVHELLRTPITELYQRRLKLDQAYKEAGDRAYEYAKKCVEAKQKEKKSK